MKNEKLIYLPVMATNLGVNYFAISKYCFMICVFNSVRAIGPLLVMMRKCY
jgi:hypothetical protein